VPAKVWREHKFLGRQVHTPWQADANPFVGHVRTLLLQDADAFGDLRDKFVWGGRGRHGFLGQKTSGKIGQRHVGGEGPDVDSKDAGAVFVQMQESRAAATRQLPHCSLFQPSFRDQLLGDDGHRAALQAGLSHQIRPRNGLMLADKIQHDAAVDVAGGLARRHLKIIQVNFTHGHKMVLAVASNGLVRDENYI